jgi:hypothetical protein
MAEVAAPAGRTACSSQQSTSASGEVSGDPGVLPGKEDPVNSAATGSSHCDPFGDLLSNQVAGPLRSAWDGQSVMSPAIAHVSVSLPPSRTARACGALP